MITEYSINLETKSKEYLINLIYQLQDIIKRTRADSDDKTRQIRIKNEYFQLIHDLGYDYDGLEKPESLKQLIDELIDLANKGYSNDDKSAVYTTLDGVEKNILGESIGDDESESRANI